MIVFNNWSNDNNNNNNNNNNNKKKKKKKKNYIDLWNFIFILVYILNFHQLIMIVCAM